MENELYARPESVAIGGKGSYNAGTVQHCACGESQSAQREPFSIFRRFQLTISK